jgi:hypothetical protein
MVNWTEFESLPGSASRNFEILCRGLIWLHYGRNGQLAALANQPGVEFHLQLHTSCALGDPGRWFGWQCRWYGLPSGRALGKTRRDKIEDALAKTAKVLPGLTDWVLWTRYPLTRGDQKWFNALPTNMQLHLWTSENVEILLTGDAEILRRTFSGDLVLTPTALAQQHEMSIARIRMRWLPDVHQTIDAERTLRRMLGEAASWDDLTVIARRLHAAAEVINKEPAACAGRLAASTPTLIGFSRALVENLRQVHLLLADGNLELLSQQLEQRPAPVTREVSAAARHLRGARLACGLDATNAVDDMKVGIQLLNDVQKCVGTRLISVLADAGGGKTQLAAQLTHPLADRPAGILLHGHDLHSGMSLDDLAKNIVIQGNPVSTVEGLIAALDAAGQRARRRLPLVIDGLNEAEDPRDWKARLASLDAMLRRFANVLVVCTLRTGARRPSEPESPFQRVKEPVARMDFANQALPDDVERIQIADFGEDTVNAIRKYFKFFRINPGDAELPFELLTHPLTLRIFCEVTNPERKRDVGIEAMPGSLTGLFEQYINHAILRIGELAPSRHRYFEQDVRSALDHIGSALWDARARMLPEEELRRAIGDDARPWNESIVHMLEQEGLILRIPGDIPGRQNVIPVYDQLGGHIIASSILANQGRAGLKPWLKKRGTLKALSGDVPNCHPLALDIFRSLAGLVPRRLHRQQLWQLLNEPLRSVALRMAAELEGSYLDAATVTAIGKFICRAERGSDKIFRRLHNTRGAITHPLNANFLDSVLHSMPMDRRDLHWTEWVRANQKWIKKDIQWLENHWQKDLTGRTPSDQLRAKWIKWLLTTTVRNLRDRATRALYWVGRGDPAALFTQTEGAIDINDPYVFERMLAASYGVAMAAYCDSSQPRFRETILPEQARKIFDLMFRKDAPGRTTHLLTREYGRGLIELAASAKPKLFSAKDLARTHPPYSNGGRITWPEIELPKEESNLAFSPFGMDFENYTLGRLVEGRHNYDFQHAGYRKVRAQILWRVQQLGWSADKFGGIDRSIQSEGYRYGYAVDEFHKIDRYGKKYSWIAYLELKGFLRDEGSLTKRENRDWTSEVDIDPSFPSPTAEHRLVTTDLLGDPRLSLANWIKKGPTPDFSPYFRQPAILGELGPWVALDGLVVQEDESRGRRLIAFIRSFLVRRTEAGKLAACLRAQALGGRWLPEKPELFYTFAGEVPWCDTFPKTEATPLAFVINERKVKVRRKRQILFVDGKQTHLTQVDLLQMQMSALAAETECGGQRFTKKQLESMELRNRIIEIEELRREIRKFRTLIPVVDFHLAGQTVDNIPVSGITLAKQLAKAMGLLHLPQTHDLQSRDGVRVTFGLQHGENFNNSEGFFLMRENILRKLLRKRGLSLVWAVWGERQLSHKQHHRAQPGGDLVGAWYANFQSVHRY